MRSQEQKPSYWPFYCEENIWHLCADPRFAHAEVVFISNLNRQVALWQQRAAEGPFEPVVWDYHVVLLAPAEAGWEVWDLDSTLDLPTVALHYLELTFPLLDELPAEIAPRFRCLAAPDYRNGFASDRRHMLLPDGTFRSPPPPWDCPGEGSNLQSFIEMESDFLGEVYDLHGLKQRLLR